MILVLGIAEAGLVALRRQFVINPATTVETRMRVSLYGHLQDLTVSFHDRWGSGQLLVPRHDGPELPAPLDGLRRHHARGHDAHRGDRRRRDVLP